MSFADKACAVTVPVAAHFERRGVMTTFGTWSFACPNCATNFESKVLKSTNSGGGVSTDFRQLSYDVGLLGALIHTCPNCGFSGFGNDLKNSVDQAVSERIAERITPQIKAGKPSLADQFVNAGSIAEWMGGPANSVATYYHYAAWCFADANDAESERRYRALAAERFRGALSANEMDAEDFMYTTYLVGELLRRASDPESAEWLSKAETLANEAGDERLAALARQQRESPKDMIDS